MRVINFIIKWTLPLTLGITIICFSVLFTLSFKGLYYWDINKLSIAQSSNISEDKIKDDYSVLIEYLTDKNIDKLSFSHFEMSKEGEIHFKDVKDIFIFLKSLMYILAIYSIAAIIINYIVKEYDFLKYTAMGIIMIPIGILILAMLNFDRAFIIFHKIAFTNDYWIFDPATDPIITILPQEFFYHCFLLIVSIILLIAIVLTGIYRYLNKGRRI
ncbi:MAG: TIGR01906 family membrane protein [Epulopiscium sp.]|nr:TIGR01906 family membrane protein [Candidatus Epulonipiscium sp.]